MSRRTDGDGRSAAGPASLDRETVHAIRGALNAVSVTSDVLQHLASIAPGADPTREDRLRTYTDRLGRQVRELGSVLEEQLTGAREAPDREGSA